MKLEWNKIGKNMIEEGKEFDRGRLKYGMWGWFFFFNDTATTEIYTLSLHDALPILGSL